MLTKTFIFKIITDTNKILLHQQLNIKVERNFRIYISTEKVDYALVFLVYWRNHIDPSRTQL